MCVVNASKTNKYISEDNYLDVALLVFWSSRLGEWGSFQSKKKAKKSKKSKKSQNQSKQKVKRKS
jgi:hypothetical protein